MFSFKWLNSTFGGFLAAPPNFSSENGANFKNIPKFWAEVMQNGQFDEMMQNIDDNKCIGACMPMNPEVDKNFDYVIGIFTQEKLQQYDYYVVPKSVIN